MLQRSKQEAVDRFVDSARREFDAFAATLHGADYEKAASLILESQKKGGRLHVAGIGKPGHVSAYMASLSPPTGQPLRIFSTVRRRSMGPAASWWREMWSLPSPTPEKRES